MNLLFAKKKEEQNHKKLIDEIFLEENKKGINISNEDTPDEIAKIIADELIKSFQERLNNNIRVIG